MISVIVPVYNVEKVLHNCIESILKQTYKDFELILVDDGSPDNSGKICDEYMSVDKRIRVFHKKNGGVSSARNFGIDRAFGKYICFIDSDDYVHKDYLKCLVETKIKYKNIDNVWCGFQTVDGYNQARIIRRVLYSENESDILNTEKIMTLHEKWLDASPCCKLFDRNIIVDNDLKFDEKLTLGEDLIFNYHYLDFTNGNIVIINRVLYNYIQANTDSLSNKYYNDLFSIYRKINDVMLFYLDKWKCDDLQKKKYYNAVFYGFENILKNTFHRKNNMTKREKYRFNNKILRSIEFINAINLSDCFIHPLYRFAYKLKHYRLVQMIDKVVSLKSR